jgi:hypothetical protein
MTIGNRQVLAYRNRSMMGIALWTTLFALAGCQSSVEESLWQQIKFLEEEKTSLKLDNEKLQRDNQQFSRQVATLQTLDTEQRTAALNILYKIEIGSRSGIFDKDKDGTKETLIVYVTPIDLVQDSIKAAGTMDVELWNLQADNAGGGLLKKWNIPPDELLNLWVSVLANQSYRISLPVEDVVNDEAKNLTVKAQFTDYSTGKTLTAQRAIQ